MQVVVLLLILATTIWVAVDAHGRDWRGHRFADTTWKWVLGCVLLWIVAFPVYLIHRGRVPVRY
jgi:cytochrome c oxidase assembly factor CtaG